MKIKERCTISFLKQTINNKTYFSADASLQENKDIANHISNSNKPNTEGQIAYLNKVSNGAKVPEYWGEVFGSALEVNSTTGLAEIGDGNTFLLITDLKDLLSEWLIFIS